LDLNNIPVYLIIPGFLIAFTILWIVCRLTSKSTFKLNAKFLGMEITLSANEATTQIEREIK